MFELAVLVYLEGSLGRFFETGHDNFDPKSYVLFTHISSSYTTHSIHSAVGIASLYSLCLQAINSASMYALTIMLLSMQFLRSFALHLQRTNITLPLNQRQKFVTPPRIEKLKRKNLPANLQLNPHRPLSLSTFLLQFKVICFLCYHV